jgi:hypothetical protein
MTINSVTPENAISQRHSGFLRPAVEHELTTQNGTSHDAKWYSRLIVWPY